MNGSVRGVSLATVLLLFSAGLEVTPRGQQPCALEKNPVTEMGHRFEEGRDLVKESRQLDTFEETRYIRARLKARGGSDGWRLVVRDVAGRPVEVFSPADFQNREMHWTQRINGSFAHFDLQLRDAASTPPQLELTEYIAVDAKAHRPYYSYQNQDHPQLQPLYAAGVNLEDRRLGDHVAFVIVGFGTVAWTCSAVLVADDILLTNWHCGGFSKLADNAYWNDQICPGMLIDFSWDDDRISSDYACSEVILTDKARDFAWIRIEPLRGASPPRPARLGRSAPAGRLRIVHHPEARQKVISRCSAIGGLQAGWTGELQVRFSHRCDTEGGSSGAPVFDDSGAVVGLHHHGFTIDSTTCRPTDNLNKAIAIDKIIERLESWAKMKGNADEVKRAAYARELLTRVLIQ